MLIVSYLAREISSAVAGLTVVLLLIFLSNEFVHYLQFAANGGMPGWFVLRLMMLEIPTMLGLLLPLGLYVGILIAYGRLYADSEMTVMNACGLDRKRLIQYTMLFSALIALITALLTLWLGPHIRVDRQRILSEGKASSIVEMITPKTFHSHQQGKQVFYVEKIPRHRKHAKRLFLAQAHTKTTPDGIIQTSWDVITAKHATVKQDHHNDTQYVVLEDGHQYMGTPGQSNYKVARFKHYAIRLPEPKPILRKKQRTLSTRKLWLARKGNDLYKAELQWRLAFPIMTLVLGFLAVPLSRVNPRQGKYAKLLPAIIIFIIYANLLFVIRRWVEQGHSFSQLGMWALHLSIVLLGCFLLHKENLQRKFKGVWT